MEKDIYQFVVSPENIAGKDLKELFGRTPGLILGFTPPGLDFTKMASLLTKNVSHLSSFCLPLPVRSVPETGMIPSPSKCPILMDGHPLFFRGGRQNH